ncbi:NAD(P)H-binding protein [Rhodococcus sp. 06-235-1A]|uniref:NAD(P)H-binding protein n=1 Tax=Rhodococcus sp. 06-235-1A TaxID=2022508 RepID=UPI0015C5BE61|nr:NAD(P)H-binding protein [Rhodococcus sp. 06-235-1A]
MTVLVTGATGKVGSQVLAELGRRDVEARAASRSSCPPFDWQNPHGWEEALLGIDKVFIVLPGGDDGHRSVRGLGDGAVRFLDVLERSSVKRVVLMTALGMEHAPETVDQRRLELRVQASSLDWTIVRPNWFHQNVTEGPLQDIAAAGAGTLRLPVAQAAVSFVDTRDIAAVVTEALIVDGHAGNEYALTGPDSLTFHELAALTAGTGIGVESYEAVSDSEFKRFALELSWDAEYIDTLLGLFSTIANGYAASTTTDVADVLGRSARTFADFAGVGAVRSQ